MTTNQENKACMRKNLLSGKLEMEGNGGLGEGKRTEGRVSILRSRQDTRCGSIFL
jgi:hypothetical protein